MRAFHGQDTRKNTPRFVKKRSSRNWSLIESTFLRAVVELVLELGLVAALKAIEVATSQGTTNPGGYITDTVTENREFPLDLAAELLVQRGATEQWFTHRWTVGYATSYLSEWGSRNYSKLPDSRIASTYRYVFSPITHEQEDPFFTGSTPTITLDEDVALRPLTENLLDLVPLSPMSTTLRYAEIDGIEVNMDSEDADERLIW